MMDLYQAAALGDTDDIRTAAEQGYDVSTPDTDGKTPLWFAVQNGHLDPSGLLIARGANIDAQNVSFLEVAVQGRHAGIVTMLWPHFQGRKEQRSLGNAISIGFHNIADFLIGTGEFGYQHLQANGPNFLMGEGFFERDTAAFQQRERFLLVRNEEQLHLNHLFFDYALLLVTKADRNAGFRLTQLPSGDGTLLKQVIKLVKGATGIIIRPVLIRTNEPISLKWILNCDIMHATNPPTILWVLLCEHLLTHPHSNALSLFTGVAEYVVGKVIWSRNILKSLDARDLSLVRQIFCHLGEVTEDTIVSLPEESTDQSLLEG